jgi:hypothetical protein
MHPDYGAGKARRQARKVVGAKPAKKMLVKPGKLGVKRGLETAVTAAASGAALKVASKLGRRASERVAEVVGAHSGSTHSQRPNADSNRDA